MKYRIPAVAFAVLLAAACSNDPTGPTLRPQFDAPPPTEGGNGAGSSGQCTGNPNDRPSSCHDQGGPGNQPGQP